MGVKARRKKRRTYTDEFKAEAVQMMLDGHSAESVAANLGISSTPLLYRFELPHALFQAGRGRTALRKQLRLPEELRRVERDRDILKKVAPGKVRERGIFMT